MVYLATTFAFVQTLVVLYLLPLRNGSGRDYPYFKTLLVLLILHAGIKLFLLGVLHDEFLFRRMTSFTSFSYGPLLYFQYRRFTRQPLTRPMQLLHLLPFFTGFTLYLSCIITRLPLYNPDLFQSLSGIYVFLLTGSLAGYNGYIWWVVTKRVQLPEKERKILQQVSSLFLGIIGVTQLLKYLAAYWQLDFEPHTIAYLVFGIISLLFLRFFFTRPPEKTDTELIVREDKETGLYEKSGMTGLQMSEHFAALEQLMQQEKLFLNPELSLEDLAGRLSLPRQYMSQVLNQKARKNFYGYINEYRVKEMVRLMQQEPDGRILEMALRVGFHSKTTLNTYFKKVTGLSPSQYLVFLSEKKSEPV
jgi:AraC-like DNA-binding protein